MPLIELTLPRGALPEDAKPELLKRLTNTVAKWEGGADNPRLLGTIWALLDERDPAGMSVGGARTDKPYYRLHVTTIEGALDARQKEGLVADVTEAILDAEGSPSEPANAARVWCHIDELADGNWGAVGKIWRLRDIAEFTGVKFEGVEEAQMAEAPR